MEVYLHCLTGFIRYAYFILVLPLNALKYWMYFGRNISDIKHEFCLSKHREVTVRRSLFFSILPLRVYVNEAPSSCISVFARYTVIACRQLRPERTRKCCKFHKICLNVRLFVFSLPLKIFRKIYLSLRITQFLMPSGNISWSLLNFNDVITFCSLWICFVIFNEFRNERPSCHLQEF
jgi:hypothetical protein